MSTGLKETIAIGMVIRAKIPYIRLTSPTLGLMVGEDDEGTEVGMEVGMDEVGTEVGTDVGIDDVGTDDDGMDVVTEEVGIDEVGTDDGTDEVGTDDGKDVGMDVVGTDDEMTIFSKFILPPIPASQTANTLFTLLPRHFDNLFFFFSIE